MNESNNSKNNIVNYGVYQEKKDRLFFKILGIIILPFFMVYLELKKVYSRKISIIGALIGLIIFIMFWHGIFSNDNIKTKNHQLKEKLTAKQQEINSLNDIKAAQEKKIVNLNKKLKKITAYSKLTDKEKAALKAQEKAAKEKAAKDKKLAQEKKEKEELKKTYQSWIKKQFGGWDGNCYAMEDEIKNVLNAPDSYKFIEHKYWEQKDYKSIIVKITFTCENQLGGTVKLVAHGKLVKDKNIPLIESRVEDFELIQ